jgi:hypothetical protein
MIKHFFHLILLGTVSVAVAAQDDAVLLGALEDIPGVYAGQSNSRKVRILFTSKDSKWTAYPSECSDPDCLRTITNQYPQDVNWFVVLDGRKIGEVMARTPKDFGFYAYIGLQDIISGTAPVIGKRSYEFSGFGGGDVYRPLVAVSKPYFKDPALWKRAKVTSEIRKQAYTLLRDKGPSLCKEGPSDEQPLVPLRYGTEDLGIRAHRSKDGWLIMTITLKGAYYCNGGDGDGLLDAQTFAVNPAGTARLLGAGLVLVDAGDYDGDGRSELMFALSLYNRGGYVLFSDDFTEQARFVFSYH